MRYVLAVLGLLLFATGAVAQESARDPLPEKQSFRGLSWGSEPLPSMTRVASDRAGLVLYTRAEPTTFGSATLQRITYWYDAGRLFAGELEAEGFADCSALFRTLVSLHGEPALREADDYRWPQTPVALWFRYAPDGAACRARYVRLDVSPEAARRALAPAAPLPQAPVPGDTGPAAQPSAAAEGTAAPPGQAPAPQAGAPEAANGGHGFLEARGSFLYLLDDANLVLDTKLGAGVAAGYLGHPVAVFVNADWGRYGSTLLEALVPDARVGVLNGYAAVGGLAEPTPDFSIVLFGGFGASVLYTSAQETNFYGWLSATGGLRLTLWLGRTVGLTLHGAATFPLVALQDDAPDLGTMLDGGLGLTLRF